MKSLDTKVLIQRTIDFIEKFPENKDIDEIFNYITKEKNYKRKLKFKPKKKIKETEAKAETNIDENTNIVEVKDQTNDAEHTNVVEDTNIVDEDTNIVNANTSEEPKVKTKKKMIRNYQLFVNICNQNNLQYFKFYDEKAWVGPTIKVDDDTFDYSIFNSLEITKVKGINFTLVRPKKKESDKKIQYNEMNYKLFEINDDDEYECDTEVEDNVERNTPEKNEKDMYESIETELWTHIPTNIKYQLDRKNRNIYCNKTDTYIGKYVDDHTIDYNIKEDEELEINDVI